MSSEHRTDDIFPEPPPIAPAVRAGNTIYLAGQVATDNDGNVLNVGDLKGQTEIIFDKITKILEAEGGSLDDVVKMVTYFAVPLNRQVAEEYWSVRRRHFGGRTVASTGVQVASLIHEECILEVDVTAVVD